jgi:hypothetical protein
MSKKYIGSGLLAAVLVLLLLALITILPLSAARPNDIGYVSTCPFAPWSTLVLALGAGVLWVVRQYILTRVD